MPKEKICSVLPLKYSWNTVHASVSACKLYHYISPIPFNIRHLFYTVFFMLQNKIKKERYTEREHS